MPHDSYPVAEIYRDLRCRALEARPRQGAEPADDLAAVLMETGYAEAVATLVAVADEAVSLYFSNGGGIIGAGEHHAVRQGARDFLATAGRLLSQAMPTETYPLPGFARVRFFLVTTGGVFTIDAAEQDLGRGGHAFAGLFQRGQELIAAIRENCRELPGDVQAFVASAFPPEQRDEALALLRQARIEDGSVPSPRLLRCAVFAGRGSLRQLQHFVSLLAVDWRDVIVAGEYELHDEVPVQVRDLDQPLQA